ncbi:MAG: hypothetical protein KGO94_00660 [Alphaproteobacteria bacterium]|nr:hypothetical protein [Alphaproteobacteria bacterium]
MKIKSGFLLSCAMFALCSTSSLAYADEDEANRLQELFQNYLTDTEGVVSVETEGDGYKVTLDSGPLTAEATKGAAMNDNGATDVKLTPLVFKLAKSGEGQWAFTEDQPIELTISVKGQSEITEKIGSLKASGTFDEKLGYFTQMKGEASDITISNKVADPATGPSDSSATIKSMKFDQTGTAAANGGVDVVAKYTLDGMSETINSPGKAEAGMPPLNLVITAASGSYDINGKGVKASSMLDLLAFAVAHQTKEEAIKDQADLKDALTTGLPLWENMSGKGTLSTISIASPMGKIDIDSIDASIDATGVVKDGKFREQMGLKGIKLPPTLVPPWATKLVPKNVNFDFTVSGFDLDAPAKLLLTQLDLSKEPPVPAGFEQVLLPAFLPKGVVDVILNPTTVENETYSVKMEGSLAAGPAAQPTGKATISAKGLDEIMKVVQAAPPEAGLGQSVAVIIAAKGIGKTGPDGALTWDVQSTPDGKITINGIDPNTLGK